MADSASDSPFTLDPVPPVVREEKRQRHREQARGHIKIYRKKQEEAGRAMQALAINLAIIEQVNAFQRAQGLKNRSAAVNQLLEAALEAKGYKIEKKEDAVSG